MRVRSQNALRNSEFIVADYRNWYKCKSLATKLREIVHQNTNTTIHRALLKVCLLPERLTCSFIADPSEGPQFMTFTSSGTWNSLNAHHQSSSSHLHSSTTSGPQHRPIPTPQRPHNVSSTFSSSLVPSNTVYSSIPPVSHTPVSHGIHAASTAPKSVIPSARPGIRGIQGIQPLQPIQHIQPTQPSNAALPVVGIKRRLGMGRVTTTGYTNKKFKPPTWLSCCFYDFTLTVCNISSAHALCTISKWTQGWHTYLFCTCTVYYLFVLQI